MTAPNVYASYRECVDNILSEVSSGGQRVGKAAALAMPHWLLLCRAIMM